MLNDSDALKSQEKCLHCRHSSVSPDQLNRMDAATMYIIYRRDNISETHTGAQFYAHHDQTTKKRKSKTFEVNKS